MNAVVSRRNVDCAAQNSNLIIAVDGVVTCCDGTRTACQVDVARRLDAVIARGVTLEMCPDSSLSYEYGLKGDHTHPLWVLFQQGARVTVNTDNLTVLDTNLEREYDLCRKMGFSDEDIVRMNNYAIEASFADEKTKAALITAS